MVRPVNAACTVKAAQADHLRPMIAKPSQRLRNDGRVG
jgi:hypothetical protein